MAPPVTSPKMLTRAHKGNVARLDVQEPEGTASSSKEIVAKTDTESAEAFRSDLNGVRSLVTCTICDQLLYEPWTLACGHTYCYSCLCSWFLPNKRKKTCPDCRSRVKQLPAPAFLVKQMVDIFVNRAELMPADETIEQHQQRQKEENVIIEADRESEKGLFKGCFSHQNAIGTLVFNEEDRLFRCGRCNHEYQGGLICDVCELEFDPDDAGVIADELDQGSMGSVDSMEMYDMEHDLDGVDSEADFNSDEEDANAFLGNVDIVWNGPGVNATGMWPPLSGFARVPHPLSQVHNARDEGWASPRSSDASTDEDEDEEDEGSLRDFVEHDDDHGHHHTDTSHVSINSVSPSDSEDEDGPIRGAVANARNQGRRAYAAVRRRLVGGSTDTSDAGDAEEDTQAQILGRSGGWSPLETGTESEFGEHEPMVPRMGGFSPLDNGTESESGEHEPMVPRIGFSPLDNGTESESGEHEPMVSRMGGFSNSPRSSDDDSESNSDDDSDTDTIGNHQSNDDEDTEEDSHQQENGRAGQFRFKSEREALRRRNLNPSRVRYDTDLRGPSVDREGDVEMSTSPTDSSNVSSSSDVTQRGREGSVEYLGTTNAVHDVDDSDSDVSPQPARRRPRQAARSPRRSLTPEYDPRISTLFAQHQSDLRDVTQRESPYFEDPHPEPSREMNSVAPGTHRTTHVRRSSPLRRPTVSQHHAPRPPIPSIMDRMSGPVIMPSSSTRPNRVQRQYTRR